MLLQHGHQPSSLRQVKQLVFSKKILLPQRQVKDRIAEDSAGLFSEPELIQATAAQPHVADRNDFLCCLKYEDDGEPDAPLQGERNCFGLPSARSDGPETNKQHVRRL